MMMAPASRSRLVMKASAAGSVPASATDPAVVGMSAVSILSLSSTGMPCSGPFELAMRSSSRAVDNAAALTCKNDFSIGPDWS